MVAPLDSILVETDAPYLTPTPHRGKVNASYLMPHTVRTIAHLRGLSEEEAVSTLTRNAIRAFGDW